MGCKRSIKHSIKHGKHSKHSSIRILSSAVIFLWHSGISMFIIIPEYLYSHASR